MTIWFNSNTEQTTNTMKNSVNINAARNMIWHDRFWGPCLRAIHGWLRVLWGPFEGSLRAIHEITWNEANMNTNWVMNYDINAGLSWLSRHKYLSRNWGGGQNYPVYPKQGNDRVPWCHGCRFWWVPWCRTVFLNLFQPLEPIDVKKGCISLNSLHIFGSLSWPRKYLKH